LFFGFGHKSSLKVVLNQEGIGLDQSYLRIPVSIKMAFIPPQQVIQARLVRRIVNQKSRGDRLIPILFNQPPHKIRTDGIRINQGADGLGLILG
jgi:hypothetical protein